MNPGFIKRILTIAALTLAFKTVVSNAANFVMSGSDAAGVSSFNSGADWTGGAVPAAGNTYQTAAFMLRTPANAASLPFLGNSLEIQAGGALRNKTAATITITNFIVDNGATNELSSPNGEAGTAATGTLAGGLTLNGTAIFHSGIYGSDTAGETYTISSAISGTGGFATSNSDGTIILSGSNTYSGVTIVAGPAANTLQLQANAANTSAGVSAAMSASSALTLQSGTTLQLRSDNTTTFTPASITLPNAADTINFDVNSVSGLATGNKLTLTGALAFADSVNQTINVTGGSNYVLGLGAISTTATGHNPYIAVNMNASPGISAVIASFTAGNYGTYLNLTGGGQVTVTGNLGNTSDGSVITVVSGGATGTLQGLSVKGATGDAYRYYVADGTLVLDNNGALTNDTSGTGLNSSLFILGSATNLYPGLAVSAPAGVLVATNNSFNCAVYLGDANHPNGGLTLGATATNYVSDGDVGFTNSGTMTIGGQNTGGTNIYANPIILGWTPNRGKSVTVVAATGGEVDFTGGILPNGTDTSAGVKVGDGTHGGTVKFTRANTYAGGTTVVNGTLLVNNTSGSGTGTNTVTVSSGGILGGTGTIGGNVVVSGKTLPGIKGATNTIGGNLAYNTGGEADFYLGSSAAGGGNDQIILSGASSALNCGGVNVGINCGATLDPSVDYTLIKLTGGSASLTGGFNLAPLWLGTTPVNSSSYEVVTLASTVVLHYNNSAGTTNLPVVTNLPASNIAGTTATLNGQVLSTGGDFPAVRVYYGTADGGTNPAAWANGTSLGLQDGTFSEAISGLAGSTTYYFTTSASNSAGVAWSAASKNFTTLPVTVPTVTNLPATGIYAAFATLNGQVLTSGNATPVVNLYYGTNDGGANPSAWTNDIVLGPQTGSFSSQVAGLAGNTTYYFTASATNPAGVAWATPSKSFTTLALTRVPVLTFHYDNSRQGQNTNETLLTLANVNTTNFGKLFSQTVDGYVYAQPLVMTNVTIPGLGVHNVVFVATENDTIYAFDADSNSGPNGGLLWKTNLGTPVSYTAVGSKPDGDMSPSNIGITGTPVIDPVSGTLYVNVSTVTNSVYTHLIHALNITTGGERSYSPAVVSASFPGSSSDGSGGVVHFIAQDHAERVALTLAGGILYAAYGSYQDKTPYHGWIIGFNATNLVQLTNYVFNVNPNSTQGALWMGGGGLVVDANTNLYFETANGTFDENTSGNDYGDSFVKLTTTNAVTTNGLAVGDYFTPYNQSTLSSGDTDLGSGAPILLPDSAGSATYPHLMIGAGKQGTLYLVNRDNMGHYNTGGNDSQIVQSVAGAIGGGGSYATPAYFNNRIYYSGKTDNVRAFIITNGVIVATPQSISPTSLGAFTGSPVVSANGTNNGIVWITDPGAYASSGAAVLHAYNATNLAQELYNSSQNLTRDTPGGAVKMTAPTVTGGKVYVGAEFTLSVYGPAIFLPTPTLSPNGGAFTNSVTVTLAEATPGVSIYYTLDGTTPTTSSPLYTGPFLLTSNAFVQVLAAVSGAVNSSVAGVSFVNTAAAGGGTGLTGAYYANAASTNPFTGSPVLVQTNATINFNWGTSGPSPAVGATNYAVLWTGTVQPQFSETYTFYTTADDGVRLYVNGQLLINDWTNQAATTRSATITLSAQQLYNLELDYYYYSNDFGSQVELAWSSPSTPQAVIPQTQLYPFTNPPPTVTLSSPANGASYTASASVTISVDADAPYNPLTGVSFYANSTFLGAVTNAPYTLTATGLGAGSYALTAVATDGSGLSATSAPVSITVVAGSGQPYGLTNNGPMAAFLNMPTTFNGALPTLLSQTGVFSNTPAMTPASGLIPYLPNVPLWSDGALKTRYLTVPNTGGVITPAQQIGFAPTGTWTFPAGTIFVKTFALQTNQSDPNAILRLETRLLVRDINGAVYGVTYKWRADNSEADLLTSSSNQIVTIITPTGTTNQTWYYPSPADCLTCHTPVANYVLGLSARQLNNNQTYPATGVNDNQLRTLNRLGLFNPAFDEGTIPGFEALSALTNLTASLEQRSRSYLDANCAQCHQPGGTGITFDARYDTPLAQQNITNYPANFSLGYDHALIIAPQDIWRSMIYQRMNTLNNTIKMPTLARNLIDTNAVAVFTAWINSLPGTPTIAPPVISPNGGTFFSSVNVTLSPPDTNAAIYYTLDGSLPTTNSFLYAGTFSLTNSATLSANAFEANSNNSVAASAAFSVLPVYFTTSGFLPDGQFQLQFAGTTGSNYVLQATTNFTSWTSLITNTATTNFFNLLDPQATNYPYRFYRVIQQ